MTVLTIAKKEYADFFYSPLAYVFSTVFLFLTFFVFLSNFFVTAQADMRPFFSWVPILYILFLPSLTMGKWADEKRSGTLELLLTQPVTDLKVIIGKWLGSVFILATVLALTLPLPLTVNLLGDLDLGPVIGGYAGLLLLGMACLAIGLYISSLTENPIIAFVVTFVALFLFYLVGEAIIIDRAPAAAKGILRYLSLSAHFQGMTRGVIDSRDLIYYFSITGFFLFANSLSLGSRRWK